MRIQELWQGLHGTPHRTVFSEFFWQQTLKCRQGHCPQDHQSGWAGNCGHIWLQKCLQRGTGALPLPLKQSACLQLIGTQFHLVLPRCLTHLVRHLNGPSDGRKCLGTALQLDCFSSLLKRKRENIYTLRLQRCQMRTNRVIKYISSEG